MIQRGRTFTEDGKTQNFNSFIGSEEHKICHNIFKTRSEGDHELVTFDIETDDIIQDWQPILTDVYMLGELLKV